MEIPGIPNQYIQTLTTNATRLGNRIQESLSEQARELAAAATSSTSSSSYLDNASLGIAATGEDRVKVVAGIKKQLDSNSERDKLDALKRLVAVSFISFCLYFY
jgi:AP-3 complex subunit beta